ncbi:MAG: hypothetical protein KDI92_14695, partial [Xanthomonadales bacterium]|nr:hypothetical protein [Xanthomonadales bacterium]
MKNNLLTACLLLLISYQSIADYYPNFVSSNTCNGNNGGGVYQIHLRSPNSTLSNNDLVPVELIIEKISGLDWVLLSTIKFYEEDTGFDDEIFSDNVYPPESSGELIRYRYWLPLKDFADFGNGVELYAKLEGSGLTTSCSTSIIQVSEGNLTFSSLNILGDAELNSNETHQYYGQITFSDGTVVFDGSDSGTVPANSDSINRDLNWNNSGQGSVNSYGRYTAPTVTTDINVPLTISLTYGGSYRSYQKRIDIIAPPPPNYNIQVNSSG